MKHKGSILILAYECYPYHRTGSAIGAQRPYQFAKNLSQLGWKVFVLCCDERRRRVLKKDEMINEINTIYADHTETLKNDNYTIIPLPSLDFDGWGDKVWTKTVSYGAGGTYVGKGFPYSLVRKFFTIYNQLRHGDYSWSWIPVAESMAKRIFSEFKIDLLIGEHGPDAGIVLADRLSRKHGIPWIADFRDPVLWPFKGLFKMAYKQKVKHIVQSSLATINVNSYWTALDKEHFGKDAYTIVNGYDHELFEKTPAHHFSSFTVSYFGSFNEEFQDILPSLKAFALLLKTLNDPKDVRLFYRGLNDQLFLTRCLEAGIKQQYLDIDHFMPREKTVAAMKGSAVLLIYSFPPDKARNVYEKKGFYPGKIFEYIGAGKPVLLLPSDQGLLASFIHDHKAGAAPASIEAATEFLEQEYFKWKKGEQPIGFLAHNKAMYTRYTQAVKLDKVLSSYLFYHDKV